MAKKTNKVKTEQIAVNNLKNRILTNDAVAVNAIGALFRFQTEDEQKTKRTNWKNGRGFTIADAKFLTPFGKKAVTRGINDRREVALFKTRIVKYAKQLLRAGVFGSF